MKPSLKTSYPSNLFFFDTETKAGRKDEVLDAEYHYLWFGYCEYFRFEQLQQTRHGTARFTTVEQFWKILKTRLDPSRPLYVFAHNVCFDLTICDFWRYSERHHFDIGFFVIDDPPTMIGAKIGDARVYFVDTLNYWRCSLAKLGESIGFPKLDLPSYDAPIAEWNQYGLNDVRILSQSVMNLIRFLVDHDLGKFSLTAPSMAMTAFRRRFMKHQIFLHDRLPVCALEREAYYGGLVENYYIGTVKNKTIYNLDVNSLYPYVMLNKFPTKLLGESKNEKSRMLRSLLAQYAVVAHVTINSTKDTYPKKLDGKLCMVNGEFETSLCGPELEKAYQRGHIRAVHHLAWYDQAHIFKDFVQFFWGMRQHFKAKKDQVNDAFCKLLMNSLYGKFGQRGYQWLDYDERSLRALYAFYGTDFPKLYEKKDIKPTIDWGNEYIYLIDLPNPITFRKFGNKIQLKFPMLEHTDSFPLISAYVTSYGRDYLRGLINIAGASSVYYCDTDSLFVDRSGYQRLKKAGLVDNNTLGKLKLEGSSNEVTFFCPKEYVFGDKEKRKGIRPKAEKIGEGVYKQLRFEGVRSVLSREPEPFIEIKKIVKHNRRKYNKGLVNPDGWTRPFTLENNERFMLF